MFKSGMAAIFVALCLAGCGTVRLVDNDVRSYATAPWVAVGASYRFEQLPSQQAHAEQQNRLEAMAQLALAKVGLLRHDADPGYSVQVAASTQVDPYPPWYQSSSGWGPFWNFGLGVQNGNRMLGASLFLPGSGFGEPRYYWRQVSLLIRDLRSAQVVYETHAEHDGPWADSETVFPAMLDAALKDFPNPPPGLRRINIEIPR